MKNTHLADGLSASVKTTYPAPEVITIMSGYSPPVSMLKGQSNLGNLKRIKSIDILRGVVMIIMAIDHVRVYSGLPAGGSTAGIFFTRWITHFCAPTFAFFAGTSAFLYLKKSGNKSELARFLITRGLLLMALELTAVRFFWMFNLDFGKFTFTGVIWMLGCCMVLLSAFVRLRPVYIGIIGLFIIFAQQLFHYVPAVFPPLIAGPVTKIWEVFYPVGSVGVSGSIILSGTTALPQIIGISIFYVLIPWIGVMMAGFGFGQILLLETGALKKICLRIGMAAILVFIAAGTYMTVADTKAAVETPFLFKLLGQQKYPPTQLYLMMTLGPVIALVPWVQRTSGWLSDALRLVGRVPMFYYLVHILLIHLSALAVNLVLSGTTHQELYTLAPFVKVPEAQRWGLPLLYTVWAVDIFILYFACRGYAHYKSDHPERLWLKYL